MKLQKIALTEISPPADPVRAQIDTALLDELTADVRRNGVLIPIHVRPVNGRFEVVAGNRRYLAACAAGLEFLPCLIMPAEVAAADKLKFTENLFRQDLTPVEEAAYFAEMFEALGHDTDKVAARLGKTRNYVESRLVLLSGEPEVLVALSERKIPLGVAEELNKMTSPEDRKYYLKWAIAQGATRKLAMFWRESANSNRGNITPEPTLSPGPEPVYTAQADIYRCLFCEQKEPMYDLEIVHVHRSCRITTLRAAGLADAEPSEPAETTKDGAA